MDKIEDRHIAEIKDFAKNYDSLTDTDAKRKLDEVMAIAQARLNTQKAYIPKFREAVSKVKTTRFFQIDNKLRAMVQCQIAQMVPLAKEAAAAKGCNIAGKPAWRSSDRLNKDRNGIEAARSFHLSRRGRSLIGGAGLLGRAY